MMRSLYSGVSGLKNHQTRMDVIGSNISNVNTVGYKSTRTIFQDIYSQTVRQAAGTSQTIGGINPSQVGLGVRLATTDMMFSVGSSQVTNGDSDLMIQGDGLFIVDINGPNKMGGLRYTRGGNFYLDDFSKLVTSDGYYVMGYNRMGPEEPVQKRAADGGLLYYDPSRDTTVDGVTTLGTISSLDPAFDPTAGLEPVLTPLQEVAADGGLLYTYVTDATQSPPTTAEISDKDPNFSAKLPGLTPVWSTTNFKMAPSVLDLPENPSDTDLEVIDLTGFTNISFDDNGIVYGMNEAGDKVVVAQIALAMFSNNNGLESTGGNLFNYTAASGDPIFTYVANKGAGSIKVGSLEMSNVDLANEFTDMIITQRGFQANSRVITTSDTMLEELVNLKR